MPKVFISHATEDRERVEATIIAPLRKLGVETWYSTDQIPGASQWQDDILNALSDCDWFLAALSPFSLLPFSSPASRWRLAC